MKPMQRCAGCAFIILAVGAISAGSLYHASRDLTQRSEYLGNARNWTQSAGHDPYMWISGTQILTTMDTGGRGPYIFDARTRMLTLVEPLSRLFNVSAKKKPLVTWDLSPDRKQILWCCAGDPAVHAANLDGSDFRSWNLAGRGVFQVNYVSWLKGGTRWVAYATTAGNSMHPNAFIGKSSDPAVLRPDAIPAADAALLETADTIDMSPSTGLTVESFKMVNGKSKLVKGMPAAPAGSQMMEVDPAPDNKHLAWLLRVQKPRPLDALIHRAFSSYPIKTHTMCSLAISNWDGSHMREVARKEVSPTFQSQEGPKMIVWSIDGAYISYVANNRLYRISVQDALR